MKTASITIALALSLSAFGQAPKNAKPITPAFLTSTEWRYDQPNVKGRSIKFRSDGTCSAETWSGLWVIEGTKMVRITLKDKRSALLHFDVEKQTLSGVGFDGMLMTGRRKGEIPSSAR